ncbi:MAG: WhiB family transcriptional regulator [Pseudonocardiaceae bacterium]
MDQFHYLSKRNPPDQFFGTLSGWRAQAACLEEDPELFFPVGVTGRALDQIEQAKAVCQRCPVVGACLEWALETNQQDGVWGGLSEDQRRTLRRRRGRCGRP